jgi:hypothetical protein
MTGSAAKVKLFALLPDACFRPSLHLHLHVFYMLNVLEYMPA